MNYLINVVQLFDLRNLKEHFKKKISSKKEKITQLLIKVFEI